MERVFHCGRPDGPVHHHLRRPIRLSHCQDGGAQLYQRAADRAGQVGGIGQLLAARHRAPVSDGGVEHSLFRHLVGAAEHAAGARRRARREPAQGLAAERRARRLFPALYPAGVGRFSHLGWMFDKDFGIAAIYHRPAQRRRTSFGVPHHTPVHAHGRPGHHLVALGIQRSAVRRGPAQHLPRDLRGRGARRRGPLGAVHAHHLAAHLADHGAGAHHPAHSAVQDFRPGLSVHRSAATGSTRRW